MTTLRVKEIGFRKVDMGTLRVLGLQRFDENVWYRIRIEYGHELFCLYVFIYSILFKFRYLISH